MCCVCAYLGCDLSFRVVVVVVAVVVEESRNKWHYCCMSVEYYSGIYYGELANPLQWPQLRKKRRLVAPPKLTTTLKTLLPRLPNNHPPSLLSFPPLIPAPILLPKPLLPKVLFFIFHFFIFLIIIYLFCCARFGV